MKGLTRLNALNMSMKCCDFRHVVRSYENPMLRESSGSQQSDFVQKSALKQLVEEIKHDSSINGIQESPNTNFAQSLTMSTNYEKMKQDLESLQEKIKSLEVKLGSSGNSGHNASRLKPQKSEEQPLNVAELSKENLNDNFQNINNQEIRPLKYDESNLKHETRYNKHSKNKYKEEIQFHKQAEAPINENEGNSISRKSSKHGLEQIGRASCRERVSSPV